MSIFIILGRPKLSTFDRFRVTLRLLKSNLPFPVFIYLIGLRVTFGLLLLRKEKDTALVKLGIILFVITYSCLLFGVVCNENGCLWCCGISQYLLYLIFYSTIISNYQTPSTIMSVSDTMMLYWFFIVWFIKTTGRCSVAWPQALKWKFGLYFCREWTVTCNSRRFIIVISVGSMKYWFLLKIGCFLLLYIRDKVEVTM